MGGAPTPGDAAARGATEESGAPLPSGTAGIGCRGTAAPAGGAGPPTSGRVSCRKENAGGTEESKAPAPPGIDGTADAAGWETGAAALDSTGMLAAGTAGVTDAP